MSEEPTVFHIDALDLHFAQKPWDFAVARRAEIDAFFAELKRQKPAVWNGPVLMMHTLVMNGGLFRGAYLETDFASFTAWKHWGRPHTGVYDCFGAAAILSAEGAVLLGVMAAHTVNDGAVYFPCGTPDLNDIAGDRVDLEASVARELKEETGCDIAEFTADPGWTTVVDGALIMQVKVLRSTETAEGLQARIRANLAREQQPELSDIRIVRGTADFDPAMPGFVTAFLDKYFSGG